MAILTDDRGRRRIHPATLFLVGSLATSCALLNVFSGEATFAFSHRVHLAEGLECSDCHAGWQSDDDPGMPLRGGCVLCHDEIDKNKAPERRIDVLFDGDVYRLDGARRLADEVIFSHRQHAAKPIECKVCHGDIEGNDVPAHAARQTMAECEDCHRRDHVAAECTTCHRDQRVDVAPGTHDVHWKKLHGAIRRAHDGATVNQCSLCHEESSCGACHAAEPPENHDNYFRRRGHGLHARMDRQDCATCHRSDSCDACHQETRPLSHTGAFGGTISNHCVGCHLPVQANECVTCHKGTPSHALAMPTPPTHAPGMNCRQCHGIGQPLPHADNGTDCVVCHR